ncbi:receptor-like protein kinase HSL1 [Nymphaea colorata]|nr:receptor-like protein kinase HSL1 [Nymphaea colorata]
MAAAQAARAASLLPFCRLFFFFLFSYLCFSSSAVRSLSQEGLFLLAAKRGLSDTDGVLSNWNPRDDNPCGWKGILCDNSSGAVVSVDLSNTNIIGPFPLALCRLSRLSFLSLANNNVNSTLPSGISSCKALAHLDLSSNLLVGTLPETLADLPLLQHLDLSSNNFTGAIPASFARFPSLQVLTLTANLLNETVPAFLGRILTLQQLNLAYNPFAGGRLPPEIGNLTSLQNLWLSFCNLVGEIPDSVSKLGNLTNLDLSNNRLVGPIPPSITSLRKVVQIELFNNSLSGEIPSGMDAMVSLLRFDASTNNLTGSIPVELCRLNLESLNLYENHLTGGLPPEIANSTQLVELKLFNNMLSGVLPPDLGKNSRLMMLDLSYNRFSGELPAHLCTGKSLTDMVLLDNAFSGPIPASYGECSSLNRVRLRSNSLSGVVPPAFWGLPHVSLLELAGNRLTGSISPFIRNAGNLSQLIVSGNSFSGEIPAEVGQLHNLVDFHGDGNAFTGALPRGLLGLSLLAKLDLQGNRISGKLPNDFRSWKQLSELNLANNQLDGSIPPQLGSLPALNYLDLSGNLLTGSVPLALQELKLNSLNLSNNHLSGSLPPLFNNRIYERSFLGNPDLCSNADASFMQSCIRLQEDRAKHRALAWLLRSVFVLTGVILVLGIALFYWRYRSFKRSEKRKAADKSRWTLTSFHKLGFSEYEILDSLDEDNVIGSGGAGKVYKAVLNNGETVAVKRLWATSTKMENNHSKGDNGFEAEVATLGKIRHRNIVKLWCCCTHRDCKLLVYEYMPNGSLGDFLHSSKAGLLDWPTRYKIAVDAAEGLSYLHHDCVPPIIHRDVKSNNILLDAEFGARVADFGVAKIQGTYGKGHDSMSAIAGSLGYIAPEYAYTLRVNEKSDIYSFGVVILELVTGKRPVEAEYGESKHLVKWVSTTLEEKGVDHVLDPRLVNSGFKEEMCKVLNVGRLCTSPLPINRPTMRRVVKLLLEICSDDKNNPVKKDGKLSPYYYEDASDHGSAA